MGMNYDWHENVCPCCERPAKVLHIGKQSGGWAFSFRAHPDENIRSSRDWVHYMKNHDGRIKDENDKLVTLTEFWKMVSRTKNDLKHAEEHPSAFDWLDAEGHSFTDRDFC